MNDTVKPTLAPVDEVIADITRRFVKQHNCQSIRLYAEDLRTILTALEFYKTHGGVQGEAVAWQLEITDGWVNITQGEVTYFTEYGRNVRALGVIPSPEPVAASLVDSGNSPLAKPVPVSEDTRRLEWLHSDRSDNVDGYMWGVFQVKFVDGKPKEVWHTRSDYSDLDDAMRRYP